MQIDFSSIQFLKRVLSSAAREYDESQQHYRDWRKNWD